MSVTTLAALYIRVSTEEQAKYGFSIDAQLKALRDYCAAEKITIYREFIDAGVSGKALTGRKQLEYLLQDARNGKFQKVVIWRLNRLARNLSDLLSIEEIFKQHCVELHSLTEHFQTGTPLGDFVFQMMGAAAQLEREQIGESVRLGTLARSKRGNWDSGNNVLGYRWVSGEDSGDSRVEVVPEEAQLVKYIFEQYASGQYGLKAITNRLNRQGHVTKNGLPFQINAVKGILNNQNYIGMVRYNVTESVRTKGAVSVACAQGDHEPLISKDLWEQVRSVYGKRSKKPKLSIARRFPLTGLLKCPQCGTGMVAKYSKVFNKNGSFRINHYYLCGSYNTKGSCACRANYIRADDVEDWFFTQLHTLLCTPAAVEKIVAVVNAKQSAAIMPLTEKLCEVNTELGQLETRQKQIFQKFENGDMSRDSLIEALNEVKHHRQELLEIKDDLERSLQSRSVEPVPAGKIKAALQQVQQMLDSSSPDQQKELLRLLVERITVPPDRNLSGAAIHGSATLMNIQITETMEGK